MEYYNYNFNAFTYSDYVTYGKLVLKTAPTTTPISLAEAKSFLRIDSDYDDDNMSLHYEMLSDEAKAAWEDLKAVDDSEFGVLFVDLDEYEHKTELLALIAALEA